MKSLASLALLSLALGNSAIADEPSSAITLALNSSDTVYYETVIETSATEAVDNSIELVINKSVQEMSTQLTRELEEKITRDIENVMP